MRKSKAFAYFRTSSTANVGEDKDSVPRQRAAVEAFAKARGIQIVQEFHDAAVRGADPVTERKGFADMLKAIAGDGVRSILVENASRFARDLIVQETGFRFLQGLGVELVAVDSPDAFLDDTPTAVLIRQVLGAVAQFEKANLVAKLAAARKRTGRHGGQRSILKLDPEAVMLARSLSEAEPKRSLREVAALLEALVRLTRRKTRYSPSVVAQMLAIDPAKLLAL
jgi:DNA invertase Pin-like site-specific DNA recombinase